MKLNSITRNYLYIEIADKIEEMIHKNKINEGEKLPSENELSKSLGVSRNIVREALKSLRERGLVEIKTGKGAYVAIPKLDMFNELLVRLNKMNQVSFNDLLDLRYTLEVNAAGYAAERANDDDICKMEKALKKMESCTTAEAWGRYDTDFHIAISEATHNVIYSTITHAISDLYRSTFTHSFEQELLSNSMIDHKKIFKSIVHKDKEGAMEAMKALVDSHAFQMKERKNKGE